MYVLLSSAAAPRYRHDILRCVSAPIGSQIQFRYACRHVSENTLAAWKSAALGNASAGTALVCFADSTAEDGTLPLIPVRRVNIKRVSFHGSTVSLILIVEDFASHPGDLATAIWELSGGVSPVKANGQTSGKFAFNANSVETANDLQVANTLEIWERLVERLQRCESFATEPFFWTVLGLRSVENSGVGNEKFDRWNDQLESSDKMQLCIYHFRPQSGGEPSGTLLTSAQ